MATEPADPARPDISDSIPLFPLGAPLFPGALLKLHVFEPRYRALVHDLLATSEEGGTAQFGVVSILAGLEVGADAATSLAEVGCSAVLRRVVELPDGRFEVVATGGRRFALQHTDAGPRGYLQARVRWLVEERGDPAHEAALAARVGKRVSRYLDQFGSTGGVVDLPREPAGLAYAAASVMVLSHADRQRVLAAPSTSARLQVVLGLLAREDALLARLGAVPATDLLRIAPTPN